eukprot:g6344.t1
MAMLDLTRTTRTTPRQVCVRTQRRRRGDGRCFTSQEQQEQHHGKCVCEHSGDVEVMADASPNKNKQEQHHRQCNTKHSGDVQVMTVLHLAREQQEQHHGKCVRTQRRVEVMADVSPNMNNKNNTIGSVTQRRNRGDGHVPPHKNKQEQTSVE